MIFRQLFEATSSTYTYLLICARTRQAAIIDPVLETLTRDVKLLQELDSRLVYGLNTHVHADHVTSTGELKRAENFPDMKTIISAKSRSLADILVNHGDEVTFGEENIALEVRLTPGHTSGCVTYVCHEHRMAFTGDALFIRGCGRTDFQEGDAKMLYRSVHEQIFTLPHDYLLYPAHDYHGNTVTTVAEEMAHNPRLATSKSEDEFVEIMHNLKLNYPKQIDKSVPANMVCGIQEKMDEKLRRKVFKQ